MAECKLCKRQFKIVNNFHLEKIHNITVEEYIKLFPQNKRYDEDVLKAIGTKSRERQTGYKYSEESKSKMSKTRKNKIASGEIITPFMSEDKRGDNNPAWGKHRRSEKAIKNTKEKNSKIISDAFKNGSIYNYGKYYSQKLDKEILYRSSYELKFLGFIDNLDFVKTFEYEQLAIEYNFDGIIHRYIPDLLVYFNCGSKVLMEIGPSTFKLYPSEKEKEKQSAAINYCRNRLIDYVIITEKLIDILDDVKHRVNCWEDLKCFCHNITGNGKCDGLKSKTIYGQSAANPLNDQNSMRQVQRLECDVDQQITTPRVPDTKVMI